MALSISWPRWSQILLVDTNFTERTNDFPRYQVVAREIGKAISNGKLQPGLILLESPLAEILQVSRATVRNAFTILESERKIRKYDGRGFCVGRAADVVRRKITALDFPKTILDGSPLSSISNSISQEVTRQLSLAMAFGHFRINEVILATEFAVSRPVVREVLWRMHELGLVEKKMHSAWQVGPLKAKDVHDEFELRRIIEPHVLETTGSKIETAKIDQMIRRLEVARSSPGKVNPDIVDEVEGDLHEACLQPCGNERINGLLKGGKVPQRISAIFARFVGVGGDHPMFDEHNSVLKRLSCREFGVAAKMLSEHLKNESNRALAQLRVLSIINSPKLPPYIERVS